MKKKHAFLMMLISSLIFSQKKLNDEAIVSQHKRMVFERWGDWRPYPKYLLGIQTNFAYATVWGNWAPAVNRRYRRGNDIRPLKPDGTEVKRLVTATLELEESKKISKSVDSIYKRNLQDLAHYTPDIFEADPLWLLYYKRMLGPLHRFPAKPETKEDWGFDDKTNFQFLVEFGFIEQLQEELDILKDKYHKARTIGMPRGKRFLMYHECLIGWRKFLIARNAHNKNSNLAFDYKKILDGLKNNKKIKQMAIRDDKIIVENVMKKYKHKF